MQKLNQSHVIHMYDDYLQNCQVYSSLDHCSQNKGDFRTPNLFYIKMAVRKHKIFCQFQTETIKVKRFQTQHYSIQTLIPTNKLFNSLD